MDLFKIAQTENIGHGGIKCSCCNDLARKKRGSVDKKLNRIARAKMKSLTRKEILKNYV